jgi:hypothetical protein
VLKLFRQILAILFALVVLVTTSGLNIYTHYCSCSQLFEVSVTAFGDDCCEEKNHQICHLDATEGSSCCASHSYETENSAHACAIDGCCTYTHEYLKISENFDRPGTIMLQVFQTEAPADLFTQTYYDDIDKFAITQIVNNTSPPPLLVGKTFVVFTRSFKIAPAFHFSA